MKYLKNNHNELYDNFETLDLDFWKPSITWAESNDYAQHPEQKWQYFTRDEVSIHNSILRLGITRQGDNRFSIGCISSLLKFNPPVTFEAKIKFGGIGLWGAFWTFGTQGYNSEIDIIEQTKDGFQTNYHYMTKNCCGQRKMKQKPESLLAYNDKNWHTYKLIWEKEKLLFFIDGNLVRKAIKKVDLLFPKHQIIIGNGIYDNTVALLEPILVDYIRIII